MEFKKLEELLSKSKTLQEALEIKKKWNADYLQPLQEALIKSTIEEKKEIGKKLNLIKHKGDEIFNNIKNKFLINTKSEDILPLDLSLPNTDLINYSFNPLSAIRRTLIDLFNNLGFTIENGKEIVSTVENFENLKVPEDHPSRSPQETFYIDNSTILRPHCTVHSINCLKTIKFPGNSLRLATIGNVYRRDDETSRHVHQFSQLDFFWLQKNLTVSNLKNLLEIIYKSLFGNNKNYRFRNSYFPFTQPSVEIDTECYCQKKSNCNICGGSGWIEILGAGLFRREILSEAGYSEEYQCLAGGLGLERIALIKYGIKDIRYLYSGNLDFLRDRSLDDY